MAEWLVRVTAHAEQRSAQLGDLAEEFEERAETDPASARRWYWKQALGSTGANLGHRMRRAYRGGHRGRRGDGTMIGLLQNIRFALRGARRHPAFSLMVVGTLALGHRGQHHHLRRGLRAGAQPLPLPRARTGGGRGHGVSRARRGAGLLGEPVAGGVHRRAGREPHARGRGGVGHGQPADRRRGSAAERLHRLLVGGRAAHAGDERVSRAGLQRRGGRDPGARGRAGLQPLARPIRRRLVDGGAEHPRQR